MLKMRVFLFMVILVGLVLSACTGVGVPQGDRANLEGVEWKLSELNGQPPVADSQPTATFADGQVGGSTGCNSYGGAYTLNGSAMTIEQLMQTEMACMAEGVMEQETAFTQAMQAAASYQATAERLEIRDANGNTLLVFVR